MLLPTPFGEAANDDTEVNCKTSQVAVIDLTAFLIKNKSKVGNQNFQFPAINKNDPPCFRQPF